MRLVRIGGLAAAGGLVMAVLGFGVAGEAATGTGFTFSPAFSPVDVRANQPTAQFPLTLRNQAATDQNFRISVVDFGSLDEQGGVAFLGAPASELEHQYGLASWMKADQTAVKVPAGGSVRLMMTIDNRKSLAPGGHYGAVLATAVDAPGGGLAEPRVGVKQVLSSLVLVTKEGGLSPRLILVSQSDDGGFGRLPAKVEQRFHNTGNVHVVPRGVTEVKDPSGRVVARGALNPASGAVLPNSYRRYKTDLVNVAKAWMPGQYLVMTTYRYDGTDETKVFESKFWYAGQLVVILLALLAAFGIAFLGWWLWRRKR